MHGRSPAAHTIRAAAVATAVSWLSTDLRVFSALAGGALPSTRGVVLTAGPNDFITRLIQAYNDPALPRAPEATIW